MTDTIKCCLPSFSLLWMMTIENQDQFCRSEDIRNDLMRKGSRRNQLKPWIIHYDEEHGQLTRRCFSLQFHRRISAKALSVHVPAQNLTFFLSLYKFETESRTRMHFAEPGRRGFVDPLGGITTRWKGRWKYTPKMKRRSKIRQKILWRTAPKYKFYNWQGLKNRRWNEI